MNSTLFRTPLDYICAAAALPHQKVDLPHWRDTALPRLTPVERATVRVVVPRLADVPLGSSRLHEAQFRLALMDYKQGLRSRSGYALARDLQEGVLDAWHPIGLRYAKRGWVLLAALDAADIGTEIWIAAQPLDPDPRAHYRHLRLSARLAELASN